MLNLKKILIGVLLASILSGCAPYVLHSNPSAVVIDAANSQKLSKALLLADSECLKYDKNAVFIQDANFGNLMYFECKKP